MNANSFLGLLFLLVVLLAITLLFFFGVIGLDVYG
jgi:hypothetical protein